MQHCWFVRVALEVKQGFGDLGSARNNYKMKEAIQEMHVFVNALSQMVMGRRQWPLLICEFLSMGAMHFRLC